MNKLILFIGLMVLTVNSYSQFVYDFDRKPYIKEIDDAIDKVKTNKITPDDFNRYVGKWGLSFIVSDTIYAISYEDTTYVKYTTIKNEIGYSMYKTFAKTRYVFLYRKEHNGWVKVSDTIQTGYHKSVSLGMDAEKKYYNDAFLFSTIHNLTVEYSMDGECFGYVHKLNNGCILMFIPTIFGDSRINESHRIPYKYNSIVIFIPTGKGTYNISKFEPINKNTRPPDLYSNYKLPDFTEIGNNVKIDIWIKAKLVGDEKPDGIETIKSERREVKIPYKIKLFCTLNFEIVNGKAYYSGDYKLSQTR